MTNTLVLVQGPAWARYVDGKQKEVVIYDHAIGDDTQEILESFRKDGINGESDTAEDVAEVS